MLQPSPNEKKVLKMIAASPDGEVLRGMLERHQRDIHLVLESANDDRVVRQLQGRAQMLRALLAEL